MLECRFLLKLHIFQVSITGPPFTIPNTILDPVVVSTKQGICRIFAQLSNPSYAVPIAWKISFKQPLPYLSPCVEYFLSTKSFRPDCPQDVWTSLQFWLAGDSPGSLNESVECPELCGSKLSSRVAGMHCSHCACTSPQKVRWTYDSCSGPVRPQSFHMASRFSQGKNDTV